jgi:alcohol dehydrogenase (cytochrome c)
MANSGSDVGAIGHIRAFDDQTGRQIWDFDVVPSTGPGAETWPTGNPGPDFVASCRPGDNLYTSSIVMLDARIGAPQGYHQLEKNDFYDWDLAASPVLFTSRAGRKMVAAAGKNGYLYGLDRDLKNVLFKVAVTTIENTEAPMTKEGTRFLPGAQGGTNWYGPTYSPLVNAIYVPPIDWATTTRQTRSSHSCGNYERLIH